MHLSVEFPSVAYREGPEAVIKMAQAIESIGFDQLDVFDHVVMGHDHPSRESSRYPAGMPILEALMMLSYAAAVTKRIGLGTEVLVLWFVPTMLVPGWLGLVFAWYPHHPAAGRQGRYVDTRVAVFPGSTIIIRGHDHHALHHLFPRVVHYKLPGLWREIGPQLTAKGVRTEGRALGATGPVVWRDQAD